MRARAGRGEFELIEGSCYAAQPGGAAARAAYERMRDEILEQLKAALPVDGVVLNLHGAMVAHRSAMSPRSVWAASKPSPPC